MRKGVIHDQTSPNSCNEKYIEIQYRGGGGGVDIQDLDTFSIQRVSRRGN